MVCSPTSSSSPQAAGKAEEAKQIDGILQQLPIKNGLAGTGLDTKRPFLFYAIASPDAISSHGALLVPIADEKAFSSFLEDTLGNFGMSVTKGSDNIHAIGVPNLPFEVVLHRRRQVRLHHRSRS